MKDEFRHFAKEAARAAADKKALDVVVLDLRTQSDVADYIVVASVESSAQMNAVERDITERLKEQGLRRLHRDGRLGDRWIALDYGGLLIHVMLPKAREFYRMDSLWENPKHVTWEEKTAEPKKRLKAKTR